MNDDSLDINGLSLLKPTLLTLIIEIYLKADR